MISEPMAVTLEVIGALDAVGAPYFLCGSLAGVVHGVVRTTADADLVADLREEQVEAFTQELEGRFYVSVDAIRSAIRRHRSFNVIHLGTMFKVDVFVACGDAHERSRFERRRLEQVAEDPERLAYVDTAEDTILAKLRWYHLGSGASARQWDDVLRLIAVQGPTLDLPYLTQWAGALGVAELLVRALSEAR